MNIRHGILTFVKFTGLSGIGWTIDLFIFLTLILAFNSPPSIANIISSCAAALMVFLLSREFIFRKATKALLLRLTIYLIYTLIVILIASYAISVIVFLLHSTFVGNIGNIAPIVIATFAKVIVTPPQLLMNFYMSRLISERQFST